MGSENFHDPRTEFDKHDLEYFIPTATVLLGLTLFCAFAIFYGLSQSKVRYKWGEQKRLGFIKQQAATNEEDLLWRWRVNCIKKAEAYIERQRKNNTALFYDPHFYDIGPLRRFARNKLHQKEVENYLVRDIT